MNNNLAALERHLEALQRPRHLMGPAYGLMHLCGDGAAGGMVLELTRYPPATVVRVPVFDERGLVLEDYRLRAFVWGDDGAEAYYQTEGDR